MADPFKESKRNPNKYKPNKGSGSKPAMKVRGPAPKKPAPKATSNQVGVDSREAQRNSNNNTGPAPGSFAAFKGGVQDVMRDNPMKRRRERQASNQVGVKSRAGQRNNANNVAPPPLPRGAKSPGGMEGNYGGEKVTPKNVPTADVPRGATSFGGMAGDYGQAAPSYTPPVDKGTGAPPPSLPGGASSFGGMAGNYQGDYDADARRKELYGDKPRVSRPQVKGTWWLPRQLNNFMTKAERDYAMRQMQESNPLADREARIKEAGGTEAELAADRYANERAERERARQERAERLGINLRAPDQEYLEGMSEEDQAELNRSIAASGEGFDADTYNANQRTLQAMEVENQKERNERLKAQQFANYLKEQEADAYQSGTTSTQINGVSVNRDALDNPATRQQELDRIAAAGRQAQMDFGRGMMEGSFDDAKREADARQPSNLNKARRETLRKDAQRSFRSGSLIKALGGDPSVAKPQANPDGTYNPVDAKEYAQLQFIRGLSEEQNRILAKGTAGIRDTQKKREAQELIRRYQQAGDAAVQQAERWNEEVRANQGKQIEADAEVQVSGNDAAAAIAEANISAQAKRFVSETQAGVALAEIQSQLKMFADGTASKERMNTLNAKIQAYTAQLKAQVARAASQAGASQKEQENQIKMFEAAMGAYGKASASEFADADQVMEGIYEITDWYLSGKKGRPSDQVTGEA